VTLQASTFGYSSCDVDHTVAWAMMPRSKATVLYDYSNCGEHEHGQMGARDDMGNTWHYRLHQLIPANPDASSVFSGASSVGYQEESPAILWRIYSTTVTYSILKIPLCVWDEISHPPC